MPPFKSAGCRARGDGWKRRCQATDPAHSRWCEGEARVLPMIMRRLMNQLRSMVFPRSINSGTLPACPQQRQGRVGCEVVRLRNWLEDGRRLRPRLHLASQGAGELMTEQLALTHHT